MVINMTKGVPKGMIQLSNKKVFKSGDSIALVIPKHVIDINDVERGDEVELFTRKGELLIRFG